MALKEIRMEKPSQEQLTFRAFELADLMAEFYRVQQEKKDAVAEYNDRLKAIERSMKKLTAEIEGHRTGLGERRVIDAK